MTAEFWGAIATFIGLIIWVIKLTWSQSQFKKNHIQSMNERLVRVETQMNDVRDDIKSLFKRVNEHINGKREN